MNQKELGELRRRFRPDRSAVSRVYGCYVNSGREIISYLDESLGQMPQEEAEKYLGLLKKALSGTLGKNLIDIVFSTEQDEWPGAPAAFSAPLFRPEGWSGPGCLLSKGD